MRRLAHGLCARRVGVEQSVGCVVAAASCLPRHLPWHLPLAARWAVEPKQGGPQVLDAWPVSDVCSLLWALYL